MKSFSRYVPNWFKVMLVCSAAFVFYGIGQLDSENTEIAPKKGAILDTLWLDRLPEMMHDEWNGYLFTSDNVGLNIHAASSFKITLEIFEFQLRGKNLRWHFPHDGRKSKTSFTVEKLKNPTEKFDRKLTIQNDPQKGGETTVYFTGPEFANGHTIEQYAPGAQQQLQRYSDSL